MDSVIITVNNESETVSARELHEKLNECNDFKEFFVKVSEYKVLFDYDELRELREAVKKIFCEVR